ncbi:hypothetical protein MBLNU230_g6091t1 [Neophaeotheca triangularis]
MGDLIPLAASPQVKPCMGTISPGTEMTAGYEVLSITELVEGVFHHLPLHALVRFKRVNHRFNNAIKTSQKACMRPKAGMLPRQSHEKRQSLHPVPGNRPPIIRLEVPGPIQASPPTPGWIKTLNRQNPNELPVEIYPSENSRRCPNSPLSSLHGPDSAAESLACTAHG